MHEWGDAWEGWDDLCMAMRYIVTEMKNNNYSVSLKEKYGTVRYEHIYEGTEFIREAPFDTPESWALLHQVVKQAVEQWPDLTAELTEDLKDYRDVTAKPISKPTGSIRSPNNQNAKA